jgi:hypothetical protein
MIASTRGGSNPDRDRFAAACAALENNVPYRSAAEQRRTLYTALWDGFEQAGLAPVLACDGALSVYLGAECVLVSFDTVPARPVDLERRNKAGGSHG